MRLPLNLIPASAWYFNVRSAVDPATWSRIATHVGHLTGRTCTACATHGGRIEAHEQWDFVDAHRLQRLAGLVALCGRCHEVTHFGRAIANGRTEQALTHYCQVNQLLPAVALQQITQALELNERRSQHAWKLDLSHLRTRYGLHLTPP